jgi:hypothetical protein
VGRSASIVLEDHVAEPISAIALRATKDLADVADQLGIIQAVKRRLVSTPDPAATKLSLVLDEMLQVYCVLDGEITGYLALWLDPASNRFSEDRKRLVGLEGGALTAQLRTAKAACSKIWNIYERYLSGWFNKVTSPTEAKLLDSMFRQLSNMDSEMIAAIDAVAAWLERSAKIAMDLVTNKELEQAQRHIELARLEIHPVRRELSRAVQMLFELQSSFLEVSRAV